MSSNVNMEFVTSLFAFSARLKLTCVNYKHLHIFYSLSPINQKMKNCDRDSHHRLHGSAALL